jgi:hypothetical protein
MAKLLQSLPQKPQLVAVAVFGTHVPINQLCTKCTQLLPMSFGCIRLVLKLVYFLTFLFQFMFTLAQQLCSITF